MAASRKTGASDCLQRFIEGPGRETANATDSATFVVAKYATVVFPDGDGLYGTGSPPVRSTDFLLTRSGNVPSQFVDAGLLIHARDDHSPTRFNHLPARFGLFLRR